MENTRITFYSSISYITRFISSKLDMLVFHLLVLLGIMHLLLGRICRIGLRNTRTVGLPRLMYVYHD